MTFEICKHTPLYFQFKISVKQIEVHLHHRSFDKTFLYKTLNYQQFSYYHNFYINDFKGLSILRRFEFQWFIALLLTKGKKKLR